MLTNNKFVIEKTTSNIYEQQKKKINRRIYNNFVLYYLKLEEVKKRKIILDKIPEMKYNENTD